MPIEQGGRVQQPEPPAAEIILDAGGWISGPALAVRHRPLARDIRSYRVGEVLATPEDPTARKQYWLRPVGGGTEWDVPPEYVQLLADDESAA